MYEQDELKAMQDIDIMSADRNRLVEISDIRIDTDRPLENRADDYLEQVSNPFLMKADGYVLQFRYEDCGKSMTERMMEYVEKLAQI